MDQMPEAVLVPTPTVVGTLPTAERPTSGANDRDPANDGRYSQRPTAPCHLSWVSVQNQRRLVGVSAPRGSFQELRVYMSAALHRRLVLCVFRLYVHQRRISSLVLSAIESPDLLPQASDGVADVQPPRAYARMASAWKRAAVIMIEDSHESHPCTAGAEVSWH